MIRSLALTLIASTMLSGAHAQVVATAELPGGVAVAEGPGVHTLCMFDNPRIPTRGYRVVGEVRTLGVERTGEGVEGTPYLQTLNTILGNDYFTRAIAGAGPMRALAPNEDWRLFELPFYLGTRESTIIEGERTPTRVRLTVHLPGAGRVEVRDVRLEGVSVSPGPADPGALSWDHLETPAAHRDRLLAQRSGELVFDTVGEHVVWRIDLPELTGGAVTIRAEVRGEGITAAEGWWRDDGVYFLACQFRDEKVSCEVAFAKVRGTEEWTPIETTVAIQEPGNPPERIELRLSLPVAGTVRVRNLEMREPAPRDPVVADLQPGVTGLAPWWSPRAAGWIGGIGGSTVGLMGALIGVLMWLRAGRGPVLAALAVTVTVSVGSLVAGLIALASAQPYAVWYPLILIGILGTSIPLANYIPIRRRLERMEMQRLRAMDA